MSKRFQPIGAEIEGNLKLLELQLENVEGGKMEVAFVFFTLVVIIPIDPLNSQIIFIKIKKKLFNNLPYIQKRITSADSASQYKKICGKSA